MSFEPINTQEQLDAIIGERLGRERKNLEEKYQGYISPDALKEKEAEWSKKSTSIQEDLDAANKAKEEAANSLAEKEKKISEYETNSAKMRIAHEMGLPYDAVEYLKGDDESSIKESAEKFKKLTGRFDGEPFGGQEPVESGEHAKERALKDMLKDLNS